MRLWARGFLADEPRAALCHLVRKEALQRLRSQRRRCHHEECAALGSDREAREGDPVEQAERREEYGLVWRMLVSLQADHREILELHLRGLGYNELGHRLRLAPGTVRSRLNRARAALRERLAPTLDDTRRWRRAS